MTGWATPLVLSTRLAANRLQAKVPSPTRHLEFHFAPGFVPVYRQWTRIDYSSEIPTNQAMWVLLTLWRELDGEFVGQKFVASDLRSLNDTQIVLGELARRDTLAAASPTALAPI